MAAVIDGRWRIAAIAIGVAITFGAAGAERASAGVDYDCSDFSNQAAAQRFFEANDPGSDPHGLDADGDGVACEALPCPCASGDPGGEPVPPLPPPEPVLGGRKKAKVAKVTDGDTIKAKIGKGKRAKKKDVRLIGIDTPEVFGGEECGGAGASAAMRELLPRRAKIKLVRDFSQDNKDRYGRLLRYVIRKGADVGEQQIAAGWAEVYVFDAEFGYVGRYRAAESGAEEQRLGVWGQCGGEFHRPL